MKIIGLVGTSGSGKTTICNILKKEENITIIDADKIAKKLSKKGSLYFKSIFSKLPYQTSKPLLLFLWMACLWSRV